MLATLRHRDFALLWTAGLISTAGDFALIVALPLHAYRLTGSTLATGGVLVAWFLPRVLVGSVAGIFVDRWDRKRTMVRADLLRAALLLPLLAGGSVDRLWLLYAVPVVETCAGLFFSPAERALLPRLVGEDQLIAANALTALNNNLGRLVGPALGGVLYAWGGLGVVVVIDAATFLVSAALIAPIAANARPERAVQGAVDAGSAWARALGDWRDGLRVVGRDRVLRAVFIAGGLGFVGEGTFDALGFAPLVLGVLGGGDADVGLLASAQAVGGLMAGVLVARLGDRGPRRLLFAGGMAGLGLTDLGVANAANLVSPGPAALILAGTFFFLAGFPVVAAMTARTAMLQTSTADAYRGRVFGALGAVEGLATLAGLLAGGALGDAIGLVPVLSAGAGMWVVGGVAAFALLPRTIHLPRPAGETARQ